MMGMVFKYRASSILLDMKILSISWKKFYHHRCNENENVSLFPYKILFKSAQKFELLSEFSLRTEKFVRISEMFELSKFELNGTKYRTLLNQA